MRKDLCSEISKVDQLRSSSIERSAAALVWCDACRVVDTMLRRKAVVWSAIINDLPSSVFFYFDDCPYYI